MALHCAELLHRSAHSSVSNFYSALCIAGGRIACMHSIKYESFRNHADRAHTCDLQVEIPILTADVVLTESARPLENFGAHHHTRSKDETALCNRLESVRPRSVSLIELEMLG